MTPPVEAYFTDADFTRVDQPELGSLSGGEVVVIIGGGLLFLVLLILIVILLID